MKIGIGNDHAAVELKNIISEHLKERGCEVVNFGTDTSESFDYPIAGYKVGKAVANGDVDLGILICGTGVGISLAANKVEGVRAVVCSEPFSAKLSRMHNNTNVLAFGARVVGSELAKMIVDEWLGAGAAITWLCGGTREQIGATVSNTLGNVGGIVCDGAKASCAAKISAAVDAAILGHDMAMQGRGFRAGEGLIQDTVEQTIASMGYVGRVGMKDTDVKILNIMIGKTQVC